MDPNNIPTAGPSNVAQVPQPQTSTEAAPQDVINALGNILKSQAGEQMSTEKLAQLLLANMTNFVKQGKLSQQQILYLKKFADSQLSKPGGGGTPVQGTPKTPAQVYKPGETGTPPPTLGTSNPAELYPPISQTLNTTNPGPVQWTQTRPTLTGGIPSGRISGTPAQIARSPDDVLTVDDNRTTRRKSTPGDQSMRRTIQDLVSSVDPNVKIEPEVEDLLLNIADEFIDSVTNYACRLAKHRGGDTLEVRDLQLHLERNHNIRIPGFASDETRISLSQSSLAPTAPAAAGKKNVQGQQMTLRSQRLQQVAQAKREAKLM